MIVVGTRPPGGIRAGIRAGIVLLLVALLAACSGGTPAPDTDGDADESTVLDEVPPRWRIPASRPATDPRTVLSLVPESATELTLTDLDQLRSRFGLEDLTSDASVEDRFRFWQAADSEAVLLTDGLLREDAAALGSYGFSEDDVDWEAHFRGPEGHGFVLAFRPNQDMAAVRAAVRDGAGPLPKRARVLAAQRLLVSGVAAPGEVVWAQLPEVTSLVERGAETTYLRRGCVPLDEALGPDGTEEDRDRVLAEHDVPYFRPLDAFAVGFDDGLATVRVDRDRTDLHDRADLADDWPTTGPVGWHDGFRGMAVADPVTGRIGLTVKDPRAAERLVRTGQLPFAVCTDVS